MIIFPLLSMFSICRSPFPHSRGKHDFCCCISEFLLYLFNFTCIENFFLKPPAGSTCHLLYLDLPFFKLLFTIEYFISFDLENQFCTVSKSFFLGSLASTKFSSSTQVPTIWKKILLTFLHLISSPYGFETQLKTHRLLLC